MYALCHGIPAYAPPFARKTVLVPLPAYIYYLYITHMGNDGLLGKQNCKEAEREGPPATYGIQRHTFAGEQTAPQQPQRPTERQNRHART
jgi:hypothetical protein